MDEFGFEKRPTEPQKESAFSCFLLSAHFFPTNTNGVTKMQYEHKPYFNQSLVLCNFLHMMDQ